MPGISLTGAARANALLFKRTKIDSANLERGMYVAQLDRPWLETPFLFQGFEIREDSELKLLRQYCKHVYIDVSRSSLPKEQVLKALQVRDHEIPARRVPAKRPQADDTRRAPDARGDASSIRPERWPPALRPSRIPQQGSDPQGGSAVHPRL